MSWININRQYEYDGTTHNLMTTDVDNYYGGAFFTDGKGKNVNTDGVAVLPSYNASDWTIKSGSATADTKQSSVYTYNQSDMWSPQHGYYTDPTAKMIITPVTLNVNLTGTTTYGNVLTGYSTTATGTNDQYKLAMTAAPDTNNTKASVNAKTGLLGSDTADGILGAGWDIKNGTAGAGAAFKYSASQQVNAGSYSTAKGTWTDNTPAVENTTADTKLTTKSGNIYTANGNYIVKTAAALTVNKADLYFTATGERNYGETNGKGTFSGGITAVAKGSSTDDAANNGQMKSWDAADSSTGGDITKLAGYNAPDTVNLIATTEAKNSSGKSGTTLDAGSWVNGDSATSYSAYTLGKGSFQSGGTNQLTSTNYNLIYVGNKTNAAETDMTGKYTIKPVNLTYNVTGSHTYGGTVAETHDVVAAATTPLKNGDAIGNVVSKGNLDSLANTAIGAAGITSATHVNRDADGNVVAVINGQAITGSTASALTPNYILTAGSLTYTVKPAAATYTVADNTKVYGNTVLDQDNNGTLKSGGQTLDMSQLYGSTTGGKANVTTAAYVTQLGTDKVDAMAAATGVKYTDAAPAAYGGTIRASGLYLNDYTVTYVDGGIKITPAPLTVTAGTGTKTYGDANSTFTFGAVTFSDGFKNKDAASLGGTGGAGYFTTALVTNSGINEKTDASTIDARTTAALNSSATDKYGNYLITYNPGQAVINQRAVTYKVDSQTRTYGDTPDSYTGSFDNVVNNDVLGTGTVLAQTGYALKTGSGSAVDNVAKTNAGEYTIAADDSALTAFITNKNYKLGTNTAGKLTVNKRAISYQADDKSKTYGDANPEFTGKFTGNVLAGDEGTALPATEFTAYTDNTKANAVKAGTDAGEYKIYAPAESDILQAITESARGNYTVSSTPGTLTITPKQLTYNVANVSRVYGESNPAFSGALDTNGLVNGDGNSVTQTATGSETSAATAASSVGSYGITADSAKVAALLTTDHLKKDYTIKIIDGALNITPKDVSYAVDDASRTYGADNPAFTGSFTGLVNGDSASVGQTVYSTGTTANSAVGSYSGDIGADTAGLENALGSNYRVAGITRGTMTIIPKAVTYRVNDSSRMYGDENPAFSGGFMGILPWDLVQSLGQSGYSTVTTKQSDAGTYVGDIGANSTMLQGLLGGNYMLADIYRGTMTITAAGTTDPTYQGATTPAKPDNQFSQDVAHRMDGLDGTGMMPTANDVAADSGAKQAAAGDRVTVPGTAATTGTDGGYITREATGSIRFLTLEDTVIQLSDVAKESGELRVDASSRTDGGTSTTVNGTGSATAMAGTLPLLEGTTIDSAGVGLVLTGNGNMANLSVTAENAGTVGTAGSSLKLAAGSSASAPAAEAEAANSQASVVTPAGEAQGVAAPAQGPQQKEKKNNNE